MCVLCVYVCFVYYVNVKSEKYQFHIRLTICYTQHSIYLKKKKEETCESLRINGCIKKSAFHRFL